MLGWRLSVWFMIVLNIDLNRSQADVSTVVILLQKLHSRSIKLIVSLPKWRRFRIEKSCKHGCDKSWCLSAASATWYTPLKSCNEGFSSFFISICSSVWPCFSLGRCNTHFSILRKMYGEKSDETVCTKLNKIRARNNVLKMLQEFSF